MADINHPVTLDGDILSRMPVLRRWTPEEDEMLRALIIAGKQSAEIAHEINRTKSAVLTRAQLKGLGLRRKTVKRER